MSAKKVVVQFPISNTADLDRWFKAEESLYQAFAQANDGYVDGHDVGQERFNIYVHVKTSWGRS